MEKKKQSKTEDVNVIAASIIKAISEAPTEGKNPAAVVLGRLGGLKGGKARAEKLSAKRRKEIAQKAATSRWEKHHAGKSKS